MVVFSYLDQQVRHFFKFICIVGVPQDVFYMEIFHILRQYKILDVDKADNIVLVLLIYGKTGVHGIPENGEDFGVAVLDIYGYHVDAGNHDILCQRVRKIEHVVDHFPLLGLNDAVLVADLHIGPQLRLGHGGDLFAGVNAHQAQNTVRELVDHKDNRGKKLHQAVNNSAVSKGELG